MRKFGLCLTLVLAACGTSGQKSEVNPSLAATDYTHKLVLLGASPYQDEMMLELSKAGFEVKSAVVADNITTLKDDPTIAKYWGAGYGYGIRYDLVDNPNWQCGSSAAHFIHATMTVIDINTNEVVAVIRQDGPYVACPAPKPVLEAIAQDMVVALKPKEHAADAQKSKE